MSYKYDQRDLANMTTEQMLNALKAKEIAPRWVVGTGYKDARKVAIDWLTEQLESQKATV
jgi:hypothetical protein|tara:strand:- start:348 stop:527 length:180 start_codon:yes stop_codon:yes gene_type:complete